VIAILAESRGKMKRLVVLAMLIVLLFMPSPVLADIAPPDQVPVSNPSPGGEGTQVRMMAETVTLDILAKYPSDVMGLAKVKADFTMRNLGDKEEKMAVRYPIGASDGWGGMPTIKDLSVRVDGHLVSLRETSGPDPNWDSGVVPWIEFDVTFPVQQNVNIVVSYTAQAVGENQFIWFNYVFSTGAGWKDTIGSVDLLVNFPYQVSELNVLQCNPDNPLCQHTGKLQGKQMTWHYEDLEPTAENNVTVTLVAPVEWQKVLNEKANIDKNPRDGEAWGRLGRAYKGLIFSSHGRRGFRMWELKNDAGAQELFRLSDEAYSRALELKPNDALWHAGYADLLGFYSYYASFEGINTIPLQVKAIQEIKRALELSPYDATVQEYALTISSLFPEGMIQGDGAYFAYPWLTQTPVATPTDIIPIPWTETPLPDPTQAAANTPIPTESNSVTPVGEVTPVPVTTESGKKGLPICGSVILAPMALVIALISRRRLA